MRYAILENNTVVNLINATQDFIDQSGLNAVLVDNIFCDIGMVHQDGGFIPQQKDKAFIPIKPMYMRLALDHFNILETIEAALELPENKAKKIAFEYALQFERDDEMINGFAQSFGLTTEQVDEIFEYAESIQR